MHIEVADREMAEKALPHILGHVRQEEYLSAFSKTASFERHYAKTYTTNALFDLPEAYLMTCALRYKTKINLRDFTDLMFCTAHECNLAGESSLGGFLKQLNHNLHQWEKETPTLYTSWIHFDGQFESRTNSTIQLNGTNITFHPLTTLKRSLKECAEFDNCITYLNDQDKPLLSNYTFARSMQSTRSPQDAILGLASCTEIIRATLNLQLATRLQFSNKETNPHLSFFKAPLLFASKDNHNRTALFTGNNLYQPSNRKIRKETWRDLKRFLKPLKQPFTDKSINAKIQSSLLIAGQALDTSDLPIQFLRMWTALEVLVLPQDTTGNTSQVIQRVLHLTSPSTNEPRLVLEKIATIRNDLVHNGNFDYSYYSPTHFLCKHLWKSINAIRDLVMELDSIESLEYYYKYKSTSQADLGRLDQALRKISKSRKKF